MGTLVVDVSRIEKRNEDIHIEQGDTHLFVPQGIY
jgi:hypothetical protein